MKKIFMTIAMFLVVVLVFAQNDTTKQGVSNGSIVATGLVDTLQVVTEANETIQAFAGGIVDHSRYAEMVTIDDDNYILKGAYAYRLDDFDDLIDSVKDARDDFFDNSEQKMMVPILAICFGVPCFTLIVALVLLLLFFMKKTQARNAIIGKAIDANYPLPDAFFTNQSVTTVYEPSESIHHTSAGTSSHRVDLTIRRDPKNFSGAVSLLAVGLALILFFAATDHWPVAFLAGGIPALLGVGKLIGYYYVPGFNANPQKHNNNNYPTQQQPPYGGYPNPSFRNTPPPASPHQNPGSYPPPFKTDRNDHTAPHA